IRGVRKLPPAHVLVHEDGRSTVRPYWTLEADTNGAGPPDVWELLEQAVELRLVADVPVGAFLSGGIDSTAIVAAASAAGAHPDTFTVVFGGEDERLYDEREDARAVASSFGTRHHELEA